jgi:hypothetical protein
MILIRLLLPLLFLTACSTVPYTLPVSGVEYAY